MWHPEKGGNIHFEVILMMEWYERSFGRDYLFVYKHRDFQGAMQEVHQMMEWLELPASASVLDLCCGMGRHSLALAEAGYQVTGVDLSEVLLEEAIEHDTNRTITFLEGDMRKLPVDGPFDAVINLFTSFGYFQNDEDNGQVLREVHRVLRPGGRFMIDFINPDYVAQHLVPMSERRDEGNLIQEYRRIENGYVRKDIVLTDEHTGKKRQYEERVRLYGLTDFHFMMERAKLRMDTVYGGYDGSLYETATSPRLIIVGSRPQ